MKSNRKYVNPALISTAMEKLKEYKEQNPECKTPLFMCAASQPDTNRAAYVRAAKRLGWNVTCTGGHVYENGLFIW